MRRFAFLRFAAFVIVAAVLSSSLGVCGINFENEMYIRVGLYYGSSTAGRYAMNCPDGFTVVSFDEETYEITEIKNVYAVSATATAEDSVVNVEFADGEVYSGEKVYIAPISPDGSRALISVPSGKKFCGMMRFTAKDTRLTVVNILKLEDYIKGVLPNEVPSSWEEECLKAAAVAARSFVLSSIGGKHRSDGFDVCSTIHCQVYNGAGSEAETSNAAVDATRSQILEYKGRAIQALYHSSSGGATESAAGAWGSSEKDFPYLTVVETPFEKYEEYPWGTWTAQVSKKELYEYINGKSAYAGKLKDTIADIECTPGPSGYVRKVVVSDPYGNKITVTTSSSVYSLFSKYVMSANFVVYFGGSSKIDAEGTMEENLSKLASVVSSLAVKGIAMSGDKIDTSKGEKVLLIPENEDDDTVTFIGKGYGHGVGLSQYGARELAKEGYSYPEILATYYPGTNLTDIDSVYND